MAKQRDCFDEDDSEDASFDFDITAIEVDGDTFALANMSIADLSLSELRIGSSLYQEATTHVEKNDTVKYFRRRLSSATIRAAKRVIKSYHEKLERQQHEE